MRLLVLLPILYVAAVLQTSLGDLLRVGHVTPDLLALTAIAWLLLVPGPRALVVAGAIGLAQDLLAPGRVGLGMACFLLVGYAITRLSARLRLDHLVLRVVAVFLGTSLLALGQVVGHRLLGLSPAALPTLLLRAVGVGAYTAGMALPVLMLIGWLREPKQRAEAFFRTG